jgi:hypothetical protein
MSGPPNPITPNFTPGVGKLVTTRFDFEKHIDGASFRHNATMIDLSPSLTVNAVTYTDVQDALTAIIAGLSPPPVYATATVPGLVQLSTAGDVQGAYNAMKVTGLRGYPITTSPPSTNNVLGWNGVAWTPTTLSFGLIPGGTPGQVLVSNASSVPTWTTISGDATVSSGGALNVAQAQSGVLVFGENGAITASSGSLTGGAYSISSNGTNTIVNARSGLIELDIDNVVQIAAGIQTSYTNPLPALWFNPQSGTFTPTNNNWNISIDANNNTYINGPGGFVTLSVGSVTDSFPNGFGASLAAGFFSVIGNMVIGSIEPGSTGGVGSSQTGLLQILPVYSPPTASPPAGQGCFVYQDNGSGSVSTGLKYTGPNSSNALTVQQIAANWQGTSASLTSQACQILQYIGAAQSTSTSPVTILTIPVPSNHLMGIWVRSVCVAPLSFGGLFTEGATFEETFQIQNDGGTLFFPSGVASSGGIQTHDTALASCTLTASISGTNILIKVTGLGGSTINWTAKAEVFVS